MIKKYIVSLMAIISLSVQASETLTLSNEFLSVIVNNQATHTGRIGIQTIAGNPATKLDDNQTLLLSKPYPWSSYTTILIDDTPVIFGGPVTKRAGKNYPTGAIQSQRITNGVIETTVKYNQVYITQRVSLVRNPATLVKDLALIDYRITNQNSQPHTIGARVMLDTWLGSNDAAPFRVGERAIQSEYKLPGDTVDYWQTFDQLKTPNVIAQGILKSTPLAIQPPDRLMFVNWGTVADYPWAFNYIQDRSFIRSGESDPDTAIALYWDPITIAPGETRQVRTAYGLGGVSLSPGALSLGLAAPAEHYSNDTDPIAITAYIQNTGGFDSANTQATVTLPESLTLVSGQLTTNLGSLAVNQTRQLVIKVRPNRSAKQHTIALNVTSDTLPANQITRDIQMVSPPIPVHTITSEPFGKLGYYKISMRLTNPTWRSMADLTYRLALPDGFKMAWFDTNKKSINILSEQTSVVLDWVIQQTDPFATRTISVTESYKGFLPQRYLHLIPPDLN